MESWTLEKAKNHFSEVVRRALAHAPQEVTRGKGGDAVVVVAKGDWERRSVATELVDFMERSPLAAALARGELDESAFERAQDTGRDIAL